MNALPPSFTELANFRNPAGISSPCRHGLYAMNALPPSFTELANFRNPAGISSPCRNEETSVALPGRCERNNAAPILLIKSCSGLGPAVTAPQ
ncbi:uncharacterized protein PAN0_007d3076 [Moesziomyces antarcticus]|uniref:Uncharacterized protein n=1 Tax=Pseudozyma antarctica TaxID=84753 RepID=A0A081CDW4_PSEA2|nr:uncharacterized protein PAN0_007d3076 [Moesziomyces antarcticus]GAK64860.1 hypothetical protein PAN0_007d3076 [Moesziomyces antarcticus]